MKICIVSGNPKQDGLCQSVINEAINGAKDAGAEVDELKLSEYKLIRCQVCGTGWGKCRDENICVYGDDGFNEAVARIKNSDALILISPVYWGETTEIFKAFIDRIRRCEFNGTDVLRDKQALIIAVPGGSGRGLLTCLEQMERFCQHTGLIVFDHIGVNRWNNDYKKEAVKAASFAMANNRKNGNRI